MRYSTGVNFDGLRRPGAPCAILFSPFSAVPAVSQWWLLPLPRNRLKNNCIPRTVLDDLPISFLSRFSAAYALRGADLPKMIRES